VPGEGSGFYTHWSRMVVAGAVTRRASSPSRLDVVCYNSHLTRREWDRKNRRGAR